MLRMLVLLLVLANTGWWTWSQGWMGGMAGGGQGDREPQRLSNQVRPEIVRILPPSAAHAQRASSGSVPASAAEAGASGVPGPGTPGQAGASGVAARAGLAATGVTDGLRNAAALAVTSSSAMPASACVEAGPFNALQLVTAQSALRAASVEPAAEVATEMPGVWMLYMGRYASQEAMLRKVEELRRRRLDYREVKGLPEFEPGLSLGRFDSRAAADEALARVGQRAVRTARVVQVAPPATLHWLRQANASPARQKQLLALRAPALGEGFAACGTSPAAQALPAWSTTVPAAPAASDPSAVR